MAKHCGYAVLFCDDISEVDSPNILNALSMFRGVQSVKPIDSDFITGLVEYRADSVFRQKLTDAFAALEIVRRETMLPQIKQPLIITDNMDMGKIERIKDRIKHITPIKAR